MKWPWVSREMLETVIAERDWLRAQNTELLNHVKRIDRARQGLSEVPREPKPAIIQMPQELHAYFDGFSNKALARQSRNEAYRRHAAGLSWDTIMKEAFTPNENEA